MAKANVSADQSLADLWRAFLQDLADAPLAQRFIKAEQHRRANVSECAVYMHVRNGEVEYVGQTQEIAKRRAQHRASGRRWDQEWLLLMPAWWPWELRESWLDAVENALISYFNPPLNKALHAAEWMASVVSHARNSGVDLPGITVRRDLRAVTGRMPGKDRVAALRERRAALGLVRLELYARPEHVAPIKRFAADLEQQQKPAEPKPGG